MNTQQHDQILESVRIQEALGQMFQTLWVDGGSGLGKGGSSEWPDDERSDFGGNPDC